MGFIIESQSGTGHGSHCLSGQALYLPDPWVGHAYDTLWSLVSGGKAPRVHKYSCTVTGRLWQGCADVTVTVDGDYRVTGKGGRGWPGAVALAQDTLAGHFFLPPCSGEQGK